MHNIACLIEYDGSYFHGWQIQPEVKTIQAELHAAIETVLRTKISLPHASGRTDAGVHARGQVMNFQVEKMFDIEHFKFGVSSILRGQLSVLEAKEVPLDFHARKSALSKTYNYYVLNRNMPATYNSNQVWHYPYKLNFGLIEKEINSLVGEHDFASFQGYYCTATSTIKKILSAKFYQENENLIFSFVGTGFLKNMVRIMVGTLVERARNNSRLASIQEILEQKDRTKAGKTAPAAGLFLEYVEYEEDWFGS